MFAANGKNALLFAVLIVLLMGGMFAFSQAPEKAYNPQTGSAYSEYEKVKILKVLKENLERDESTGGLYRGTQELQVEILSGEHRGEVKQIVNTVSVGLNVIGKPGQTIIADVSSTDASHYSLYIYSYYRFPVMLAFVLLFFGLLWWIGGVKGLKSIAGILFTFVTVIFLFIPMLYRGYSPIYASVLLVILTTCVSLLLLNGWSAKSWAAIWGTAAGMLIAGITALLFQAFTHISGFNLPEDESLIVIGNASGMQISGLLFAGVLLASLGAVMDVGISVASAVAEVYAANPDQSRRELYKSGVNVGRDMMGTMANTLILAFTGTSLASLTILYAMKIPFTQLTNMNLITIEVMQGITGGIGVVLTVPIVAYIAARMIPKFDQQNVQSEAIYEGQVKGPAEIRPNEGV